MGFLREYNIKHLHGKSVKLLKSADYQSWIQKGTNLII